MPFALLAVVAGVAFPFVRFGQQRADVFEIGGIAVFDFLPHESATSSPCADCDQCGSSPSMLIKRLAERRRVVIKICRRGIERGERIESGGAEAEDVERIQHHHIADACGDSRR